MPAEGRLPVVGLCAVWALWTRRCAAHSAAYQRDAGMCLRCYLACGSVDRWILVFPLQSRPSWLWDLQNP